MTSDYRTTGWSTPGKTFLAFCRRQDGAVTIDWVALTAFTLMLGMGAAFYVASSVPQVAERVGSHLENTTVTPE